MSAAATQEVREWRAFCDGCGGARSVKEAEDDPYKPCEHCSTVCTRCDCDEAPLATGICLGCAAWESADAKERAERLRSWVVYVAEGVVSLWLERRNVFGDGEVVMRSLGAAIAACRDAERLAAAEAKRAEVKP